MARTHVISDTDTLNGIALTYLGDAARWTEIVEYNNLVYPYISDESYSSYASGYLKLVRANYSSSAVIRKGWTFKTKPYTLMGGIVKVYEVTADVEVPAGEDTAYAHVQCTVPGAIGNVMEGFVTEVGDETNHSISSMQFTQITNDTPITGGEIGNVRRAGDTLLIPTSEEEMIRTEPLEEDLVLDKDGFLVADNYGDLASVSGVLNITRAVADRVMSATGELTLHPEYGQDLDELIGAPRTPYTERLAAIRIHRALAYEERISEITINSLVIEGTSVRVDISYKIKETGEITQQEINL